MSEPVYLVYLSRPDGMEKLRVASAEAPVSVGGYIRIGGTWLAEKHVMAIVPESQKVKPDTPSISVF